MKSSSYSNLSSLQENGKKFPERLQKSARNDSQSIHSDNTVDVENSVDDVTTVMASSAPDGGWAWVVCASSFMCNVVIDGVLFTYGLFYVEFLDFFKQGKGMTSLVGSVIMGMSMLFGPFCSILINIWGLRLVSIAGSLLTTVSFACSVFAPNLQVLTITYGFFGGIGCSMTYVSAIIVVGFYFDKKRALANGITSSGSGIGAFIFSPLCKWLIDLYSWKGAILILGGIVLNCVIFSALYRPLKIKKVMQGSESKSKKTGDECVSKQLVETCKSSLDIQTPEMFSENNSKICNQKSKNLLPRTCLSLHEDISQSDTDIRKNEPLERKLHIKSIAEKCHQKVDKKNNIPTFNTCHNIYALTLPNNCEKLSQSYSNVHTNGNNSLSVQNHSNSSCKNMFLKPLQKKDIFYSGSLVNLYKRNNAVKSKERKGIVGYDEFEKNHESYTPVALDDRPRKSSLAEMTGVRLLLNPVLIMFISSSVLWTTHSSILTILPHHSIEHGASASQASSLLSAIGVTNTLARILAGWLTSQNWFSPMWINVTALLIGGMATLLMPFCHSYIALLVLSAIFGCCMATWTSLRPILLVELLGIDRLTNSLGLLAMFQGIAFSIGPPIAGMLRDATETYTLSFVLAGAAFILSGTICIAISRIQPCLGKPRK